MGRQQTSAETSVEEGTDLNHVLTPVNHSSQGACDQFALLAQIPCIVYEYKINHVTGASSFPYVSEFCEELLGVSRLAVEANANVMVDLVHVDEVENFTTAILQSMQTLEPFNYRMRAWNSRENVYMNLLDRSLPFRAQEMNSEGEMETVTIWKGFIIEDNAVEVSKMDQAKEEVLKEEVNPADDEWMKRLTGSPLVLCFSLDRNGAIRLWSDALQSTTGYKASDVKGSQFSSLFASKDSMLQKEFLKKLQTNSTFECSIHDKEGEDVHLIVAAKLHGSVWCVTCQDVTQLRQLEHQCNEVTRLMESERSLTEWLSHEIRNPLSVVMESTQAMEQSPTNTQSYLRVIRLSTSYVVNILTSILDLNELSEGRMELRPENCNLYDDILSPTQQILNFCAKVPIEVAPFDRTMNVFADKLRLQQVITNLVSNSIKYTSEGYIRISVHNEDSCFEIRVSDTGVGIKAADYTKLFNRYEKLGSSVNGSGIGLSLCNSLVKAMKGELYLNKKYHAGITKYPGAQFIVRLPFTRRSGVTLSSSLSAAVVSHELVEDGSPRLKIPAGAKLTGKFNILVIDDEKVGQKLLVRRFSRCFEDANVHYASSGEVALDMAKKTTYDLITVDHYMKVGEMNGSETIQAMRREGVDAAVIGISGNAKRAEHLAAGADDFFQKPLVGNDVLLNRLSRILGPPNSWKVLLVNDDKEILSDLEQKLRSVSIHHPCQKSNKSLERWSVTKFTDANQAAQSLQDHSYDLVVAGNEKLLGAIERKPETIYVLHSAPSSGGEASDIVCWPVCPSIEEMRFGLFQQLLRGA